MRVGGKNGFAVVVCLAASLAAWGQDAPPAKTAAQERLLDPGRARWGVPRYDVDPGTLRERPPVDAASRPMPRAAEPPTGDWGERSADCPSRARLRALADGFLAVADPRFPELESPVPGLSVSWSSAECGTFTYAAGLRDVENGTPLTAATPMGLASMTKPIVAAVTLRLFERGAFGPRGLDTPVDRLLTADQVRSLTVGDDPANPRCPGTTLLLNRTTGVLEPAAFSCPDLSQVTLRDLMVSNHGMYDFLNEVFLPDGSHQYTDALLFELWQFLGLPAVPPPGERSGLGQLTAYGLKRHQGAVIGGNLSRHDFEISLGNTGFQLLAVILETRTGQPLDRLIRELVVEPLGLEPIFVYVEAGQGRGRIAEAYNVFTGEPVIEDTGVYDLTSFHGHTLVNNRELGLGLQANVDLAGGAGGLVATPRSYRRFLDALVNGGLLGRAGQRALDRSYVPLPNAGLPPAYVLSNGFGLVHERFRELPGVPDGENFFHDGRLPGVRCTNGVFRPRERGQGSVTGVICANTQNVPVDVSVLWFEFLRTILGADAEARLSEAR